MSQFTWHIAGPRHGSDVWCKDSWNCRRHIKALLFASALAGLFTNCCISLAFTGPSELRSASKVHRRARGGESLKVKGQIQPLGSHLLVRLGKPEQTTQAGLILPGRHKPDEGEVVSVGPGERSARTGKLSEMSLAVGSKIKYSSSSYLDKFDVEGVDHALMREDDVLFSFLGEEPFLDAISMSRGKALVLLVDRSKYNGPCPCCGRV